MGFQDFVISSNKSSLNLSSKTLLSTASSEPNSTNISVSRSASSVYPKDVSFLMDGPTTFFFVGSVIIAILGTLLNLLAILVLTQSSGRRRSDASTKFVLNLALADLMFCSVTIPCLWLQVRFRSYEFWGEFLCEIREVSFFWTFQVSLYTLSCVSFNRMVKICHYDKYSRIFNKNHVRCIIFLCWLVSLSLSLLPVFDLYGNYKISEKTKATGKYHCGLSNSKKFLLTPVAFYYTIGFLVPFTTIVISYVKIYLEVQKHRSSFLKSSISNAQSYKLFQTILMIFAGFILCYFPNLIIRGWTSYTPKFPYLRQVVKLLLYFNACLNPIIYFTMNQEYRSDLFNYISRVFKGSQSFQSVFVSMKNTTQVNECRLQSRFSAPVVAVDSAAVIGGETNEVCVSPVEKEKNSSSEESVDSRKSSKIDISFYPNNYTRSQRRHNHEPAVKRQTSFFQQKNSIVEPMSGKQFITVGVVFLLVLVVIASILDFNRLRYLTERERNMIRRSRSTDSNKNRQEPNKVVNYSWINHGNGYPKHRL